MKKILPISLFCIIIDQVLKIFIITNFNLYEGITVIPHFFSIIRVHNTGAAWSFLSGNTLFLSILSIIALIVIYKLFIKDKELTKFDIIIYGVLIGGIVGNLIDRVFRGYVIDYLDFTIFNYSFPVFNFADMCIVISVCLLIILQLGVKKDECYQNKR